MSYRKAESLPNEAYMSNTENSSSDNDSSLSSNGNLEIEVDTDTDVSSSSDDCSSKLDFEDSHDVDEMVCDDNNENKENEYCSSRILRIRSNSVICDSDSESDVDGDGDADSINTSTESSRSSPSASLTSSASEVDDYENDGMNNTNRKSMDEYDKEMKSSPLIPYRGEKTPGDKLSAGTASNGKNSSTDGNSSINNNDGSKDEFSEKSEKGNNDHKSKNSSKKVRMIRQCPLPALAWANAESVWLSMCKKDELTICLRDGTLMDRHPGLNARMRAILLDWMIEVCEVYKLHRETYYLAVDFLDRYLTIRSNVQKTHLQLIGVTCLFVAAKVEEIYPPKITDFAYVTDGACRDSDILHHEILLLQALDWNISPITAISWLGVYMQLNVNNRTPASFGDKKSSSKETKCDDEDEEEEEKKVDNGFIYPQFSGFEFMQTAQLLDLCTLDVGFCNYTYSVLAAAAISHTFNKNVAISCSGMEWKYIEPCAQWMEPFFVIISQEAPNIFLMERNEQISTKFGLGHICPNIITDDSHILQTHSISMDMFDRGNILREHISPLHLKPEASPATDLMSANGMLTPPASSRKPLSDADDKSTANNSTLPHNFPTKPLDDKTTG